MGKIINFSEYQAKWNTVFIICCSCKSSWVGVVQDNTNPNSLECSKCGNANSVALSKDFLKNVLLEIQTKY